MLFSVEKKTGFSTMEKPVLILDAKNRKPFYYHKKVSNGLFYFNLPKGEYYTENKLNRLKTPIPTILPKLPLPEKSVKLPKRLKVYNITNPNKASIDVFKHEVTVDPAIYKLPLPAIVFCLFHEVGHFFYYDEKKCDLFAAYHMLKRGFNPSQCGLAIDWLLSDKSEDRKICLIQKMKSL